MEQVEFLQACGFLNMGVFSIIDNQTTFTCFPLLKYYENRNPNLESFLFFFFKWTNSSKTDDTFLPPPKLHLSDPIEDIRKSMVIETGTELKCVQSVGISFEQNPRFRPTMEDEHVIIDSFAGNSNQGFFAIYDGHGGRETVEYLKNNFHLVKPTRYALI